MGLKILMVLNGLDIGGAETHVAELSLELARRGHQVVLASQGGAFVPMLEERGLRHYTVPLAGRRGIFAARRLLKQIIRMEKPDVVHAHARIPGFVCGSLQKKLGFPFVTTAHWVFRTNPLLNCITDWGQQTLAVSPDIREYLIRNYRLPAGQITVTVNGIDTGTFCPQADGSEVARELGIDPDAPVLLTVSRLDSDRSLVAKTLLQLAPRLKEEIPDLQLVVVGGGTELAALMEQAGQLNQQTAPWIFMTGPRTRVAPLVALCRCFVGVSRAALEAMSAGKPVILAGDEGYQGLLTPKNLAAARESNFCCRGAEPVQPEVLLQDIVATLAMSRQQRQTLGDFGRGIIQNEYSVARMAEDCLQVYQAATRRKE